MYHVKNNQKGAEVAILISDPIDFKTKIVTRENENIFQWKKGQVIRKI